MWEIRNTTDFAADGSWVQDKDAKKYWLVCVKATFAIAEDGRLFPSALQEPVLIQARHREEDFEKSLLYESDFFGIKPATDVVVNGLAWVPGGVSAEQVDIGLAVGPIRKPLRVLGNRVWRVNALGGASMTRPEPFERMPLFWENAFGGWDRTDCDPTAHRLEAHNPVGKGFVVNPDGFGNVPLPNIEDPANLITSPRDKPVPVGFAPVSCAWSPRRELAGTYDETWQKNRFPLWATDLDPRYYCAAPLDQLVPGYLKGGETVHLKNLSRGGRMQFDLPRLIFGFATRIRRQTIHHSGFLASVVIEPEFPRVIMTWQSALCVNHKPEALDATTVRLKEMRAMAA